MQQRQLDNPLQALQQVYTLTNQRIWLKPYESVRDYAIAGNKIVLIVNRAISEPYRRDSRVIMRGIQMYEWTLDIEGVYQLSGTMQQWWSTSELHTSRVAHKPDHEWEDMCYRPGNDLWPLDNTARKAQGY